MIRFKGVILILLPILFQCTGAMAADLTPGRLIRVSDEILRNRLTRAHLARDEPVDAHTLSSPGGEATAADLLNRGSALSLTGRFIRASEAFHRTLSISEPGSEVQLEALEQFIKVSDFKGDLALPPLETGEPGKFQPDLALSLSGYLADRGDREAALAVLDGTSFRDDRQQVISGMLRAGHLAVTEGWEASAELMEDMDAPASSDLADFFHLTRGHHHLQASQPDKARTSFHQIPSSSPFAPEALLGKAWSLIRTGDTIGAVIALEELVELQRYSRPAREGVLDLALAYRELGLYDRAINVLKYHRERLGEVRSWLLGLGEMDLGAGTDMGILIEGAIDGAAPDPDLLDRTPFFVRQWIMEVSGDVSVRHLTALMKGSLLVEEKAARLHKRMEGDLQRVRRELYWVDHDLSRTLAARVRIEGMVDHLDSIGREMSATLQNRSLDGFASERTMLVISKARQLRERLSLMESSVDKAEGFTSLINRLSRSVTVTSEEGQLNQIRKEAYEGLVSSRLTLRKLRNTLTALEGRLWLEVKGGAIQLERKTALRVNEGRARAEKALAGIARSTSLLTSRREAVEGLEKLLLDSQVKLETDLAGRLESTRKKADGMRAARLVSLAVEAARNIRELEAKTLFTLADIEISRMERTVDSLQEAVQ